MTDAVALSELGREKYLRLSTFRRTGVVVHTPVWVAAEGDELWVVISSTSGKAKRLAHTSRVLLTPCDVRGVVAGDAVGTEAQARLDDSAETVARLRRLLAAKYGLLARLLEFGQRLRGLVHRSPDAAHPVAVRITAAGGDDRTDGA